MKILTVLGTRPEIIRLSRVIARLDAAVEHVVFDTGQNFDPRLSDIFYAEMGVRAPDERLVGRSNGVADQIGRIFSRTEELVVEHKPDRLLVLGDTNSALAAFIAKRMAVPVFHMEAGNRCYDDRVPEEINRRVIDHSSDVLMPYTERSRANLLREGISSERVFVTGNPILEVIEHHRATVDASPALANLELRSKGYALVTLHRAENVDRPDRLSAIMGGLEAIAVEFGIPVIVSVHPRLRDRVSALGRRDFAGVRFCEPFGFFDFIHLETHARLVLTDSGTVQEECAIFRIPNVTIRDVTERPETIECGSNILSGASVQAMLRCARLALAETPSWTPPAEYLTLGVSATVVRIATGYHHGLGG